MLLYILLSVLMWIFYVYFKVKYIYWTRKGVRTPLPIPLVGNFGKVILLQESLRDLLKNVYNEYPNEKIVGLYKGFTPVLLVRDPELIKQVLIKDFHVFQERGRKSIVSKLGVHLFMANGETWRLLRKKLSPLFSTKKLKDMMPLIEQCVCDYINYIDNLIDNNKNHEIRSLMSKYARKVTVSCIFGLELDTFKDDEEIFSVMARKIFQPPAFVAFLRILNNIIPGIVDLYKDDELQDFFVNLVPKVNDQRKKENKIRNDFIFIMTELRKHEKVMANNENGTSEIEITDCIIAAQAFLFYAAGFESLAGAMSFIIHELALHEDIQNKLYNEICKVTKKHGGKINYEAIKEMTYLEMVFHETMRRKTLNHFLTRKALEDYNLPETNVCIQKGTLVYISPIGLHSDRKYYDNPEKFDPEHFAPENVRKRSPCTYLAFGDGPRNCIGTRFAMLLTLMGTAAFFMRYRVEPSAQTKTTLQYKPTAILLKSKDGIWVQIIKR